MRTEYRIDDKRNASSDGAAISLARIERLIAPSASHTESDDRDRGRNLLTQTVDITLRAVRSFAPPIHWIMAAITATIVFAYIRLVALTARLLASGERLWPDVPAPCVVAMWHQDAPSLMVAVAKRRPHSPSAIMIARDARGDMLALVCRMLGFEVARGGGRDGGWNVLVELAHRLEQGASVFITADGGGPARIAKIGAVALASAAGVPLIPLAADCSPAIQEHHKWDAARNPIPFGSVSVSLGPARTFEPFTDLPSIWQARNWLEETLNELADKQP